MARSVVLIGVSLFLVSVHADAQELTGAPPPGAVPVHVRNEDPTIRSRLTTREGVTVAMCTGSCTMYAPPGQYVFESSDTEELRAGKKKVTIGGPTTIDVSPGSKSSRNTGLILGSVGGAAFLVGAVGAYVVFLTDVLCSSRLTSSCERPSYMPWLLTMLGGAAVSTTGWIMFGTAGTKVNAQTYAPAPPRFSLAPTPLPGGAGVSALVSF